MTKKNKYVLTFNDIELIPSTGSYTKEDYKRILRQEKNKSIRERKADIIFLEKLPSNEWISLITHPKFFRRRGVRDYRLNRLYALGYLERKIFCDGYNEFYQYRKK